MNNNYKINKKSKINKKNKLHKNIEECNFRYDRILIYFHFIYFLNRFIDFLHINILI